MRQSEQSRKNTLLSFGGFTLDLERRALFRGQTHVRLTSKPLETLIFLIQNRARTVEKQEFFDTVWKDTFVTEDTLVHAVREIRRALGDNKEDPNFIQTVPRHGYRFIAEVTTPALPSNSPSASPPDPPPISAGLGGNWRWAWGAGVLILLFVMGWFLWPRHGPTRASVVANEGYISGIKNQITTGEFFSGKPAFSPDGKFILYVSSEEDTRGHGDLFVRQFPEGNAQRITNKIDPSGDLPVFTADGSHVVFSIPRIGQDGARHHDLWMVPSFGGPPTRLLEDASGAGFSPDKKWVGYTKYLSSGSALLVSPASNLQEHYEISKPGYTPRWSPNGEWLAYSTADPNEGRGDIEIGQIYAAPDGKLTLAGRRQLTHTSESIYGLTWTADSHAIIFASQRSGAAQLYKVSLNDGVARPLLGGVGQYIAPSTSANGNTLVFQYFRLTNDLMTSSILENRVRTGYEARNITFDQFHLWPRISPSGEKLVSVIRNIDNSERLFLTDSRTREGSQLSDRAARHPAWLNDVEVAFLTPDASSENTEVVVVNTATRESRSLTVVHGRADWLAVDGGGKRLALVLKGSDHTEKILMRNLVDQTDSIINEGSEYEYLRWSADGASLAWNRPGASLNAPVVSAGIWTIALGTSEPQLLVEDGYCPVWSSDGTAIYYVNRSGHQGLWRYDLAKRKRQLICNWNMVFSYDVVGQHLVFVQHKNDSQIYSISIDQ